MEESGAKQARTVGRMMLLTLIGKVLGLVRDMMLGRNFGTGMEANAFLTASRIPRNFFDAIFASAIAASFIPVFNEYLEQRGKKEAFRFADAFLTVTALLTALLSALGMVFSAPLTALLADGFDAQTAALCASLLRILFPTMLFTGVAFSLVGILQSLGEFDIPALLSALSNGIILLYYFFFCDRFGITGLAVAFLLGWGAQVAIQLPKLHRFGYRFRPSLRHEGLHKIWALMLPVLVSTWVQPLNLTVATKYASHLASGAATSALEYANTLYTIVAGVFVLSLANVVFPEMSRMSARQDGAALGNTLSESLGAMLYLLTPMAVGLAALSRPVVRLLYEWGNWGEESSELTSGALLYLALGMIGYGLQILLSRACYAEQKGALPLVSGALSVAVNLLLCAVLSPVMGIRGLALASSVSLLLPSLVMLFVLARRYEALRSGAALLDFGKILLSACAMGAGVVLVLRAVSFGDGLAGRILTVLVPTAAGVALYLAFTVLFRVRALRRLKEYLPNRRKEGIDCD